MDQKNPFESPVTFRLHRAEYLLGFAVSTALIVAHADEIRWIPALALFAHIDVIGYLPGAVAFRRSPDGRIPRIYYVLYNTMHSLVTQSIVVGLWLWLIGPEWALLAVPWHVFGDRGVFGNFLKPFGLPFEPAPTPDYERLAAWLADRSAGAGPVPTTAEVPVTATPAASQ